MPRQLWPSPPLPPPLGLSLSLSRSRQITEELCANAIMVDN